MRLALVALFAACSSSSPAPPPAPPPAAPRDAGRPGVKVITGFDPASGMHLDPDVEHHPPASPPSARGGHPIDITLRSSPSGAMVMVDGVQVGTTPAYWHGQADGTEHQFTFVLPGHEVAFYHFVPITSGVIHARLEQVAYEDAGVDESDEPAPAPAPPPPTSAPPPPTSAPPPVAAPPVDAREAAPSPELGPQP